MDPIFKGVLKTGVQNLDNPGVQTAYVMNSFVETPYRYNVTEDPRIWGRKGKFSHEFILENAPGDGTVPAWAALLPALKWSWEFNNNKTNAKGIKLFDVCAIKNQKSGTFGVYDKFIYPDTYEITKTEYVGLKCECVNTGNGLLDKKGSL